MDTKSKKKILYIITKSVWAGAGKYTHDLATNIPRSQFDVFVAAGGNGAMAQKIKAKNIQYYNIKNFQRDVSALRDFFAFFEIFALLFKIKPDIIHVSSSKAGGIAGLASFCYSLLIFRYSLLKIFTAHGWAFHEDRPEWQISLIKLFSKITCLFYNKIICVSEFDRQSAIKNKVCPEKKLLTIHNGIKPDDYNFLAKETARQQLGSSASKLNPDELWIGTIGEDTKNKGHEYLKRAHEDTIILSNLPQGYNYLKAFDIFVLPSIKEGLPYVLLEAGLARAPVIATRVGGIPEIIEHKKTGILINPGSARDIKEAIEELANDIEMQNNISFALWEKVNREFNFKKMLDLTLSAYEKNS
ncbi:glycosyltransferase [Patescibacteria group bacterium]|nr:glycosyltransferase [Patescibacteria group bacterium]